MHNFFEGFSSKRGYQYVPFAGVVPEILDLNDIYKLSQKDPSS